MHTASLNASSMIADCVKELTRDVAASSNLVSAQLQDLVITCTEVHDVGFPDTFPVISTMSSAKPCPASVIFLYARNIYYFRQKLLVSKVLTSPRFCVDSFAEYIKQSVTDVSDKLAYPKLLIKQCGRPTCKRPSSEAIPSRRCRSQLDRRIRTDVSCTSVSLSRLLQIYQSLGGNISS